MADRLRGRALPQRGWARLVSAYDLMCRSWYDLTYRGQAGRSCHVRLLSSNRGESMFEPVTWSVDGEDLAVVK